MSQNWASGGFFPLREYGRGIPSHELSSVVDGFRGRAFKLSREGFHFRSITYPEARRRFITNLVRWKIHSLKSATWKEKYFLGRHLLGRAKKSKRRVRLK